MLREFAEDLSLEVLKNRLDKWLGRIELVGRTAGLTELFIYCRLPAVPPSVSQPALPRASLSPHTDSPKLSLCLVLGLAEP